MVPTAIVTLMSYKLSFEAVPKVYPDVSVGAIVTLISTMILMICMITMIGASGYRL